MYATRSSRSRLSPAGYLARPKMALKYPKLYGSQEKLKKGLKHRKFKLDKMQQSYTESTYREAMGRLKMLLADSYNTTSSRRILGESNVDETDNQSVISSRSRHSHKLPAYCFPIEPRKYLYTPYYTKPFRDREEEHKLVGKQNAPELMSFIERQEEYIEQLEKESQLCREELSSLMSKVRDVISENENMHEKQKVGMMKSVLQRFETETETETELELDKKAALKSPKKTKFYDKKIYSDAPPIVFESRISELEAQLTQAKIDMKKTQDENDQLRRRPENPEDFVGLDVFKRQIENLQREKDGLVETVAKLQAILSHLRDKDNDATHKIKRSLDVVEQAQFEKTQMEAEIRRLRDELERQHSKLRESISDQARRVTEERSAIERRYTQQIEQLTHELGVQWETTSKIQLDLDKQRRDESDLRRELAQKLAHIEELKKELHLKTAGLQSDLAAAAAEKSSLEQQIASLHLANERAERQAKQEASRLQAEIQSLRQRLDRADSDLLQSRRENLRLAEQVAALQKEINLSSLLSEEKVKKSGEAIALPPPSEKEDREKELSSMIMGMEAKHVANVAELEGMIHSQNQLMEKLRGECHLLTQRLEDSSFRHKEEIRQLQANLEQVKVRLNGQSSTTTASATPTTTATATVNSASYKEPISTADEQKIARTPSLSSRKGSDESPQTSLKARSPPKKSSPAKAKIPPPSEAQYQPEYDQGEEPYDYQPQQYSSGEHQYGDGSQQQQPVEGYSYDQQQAYDQQPYDQQTYDQQPYDQQSYEQQPYDQQSYDQQPYDQTYDQSQIYDGQPQQQQQQQQQYQTDQSGEQYQQDYSQYEAYGSEAYGQEYAQGNQSSDGNAPVS